MPSPPIPLGVALEEAGPDPQPTSPRVSHPLPRITREEPAPERGAGPDRPVEASGQSEIFGLGSRTFLATFADSLGAEPGSVEAGHEVATVGHRSPIAEPSCADLAPGRGDDGILHAGSAGAQEDGRFVQLVDPAQRNQQEPRPRVAFRKEEEIDMRELDRGFAPFLGPFPRGGMLELDLRVEQDPIRPLVAEVEDRPEQVRRVPAARKGPVVASGGEALVERLSVASDRDPLVLAIHLRRCRSEPVNGLERSLLGGLSDAQLLDLPNEQIDAPLQLGYPAGSERCRGAGGFQLLAEFLHLLFEGA